MESKKLGFGLMRLPLTEKDNQESIDMEQSILIIIYFIILELNIMLLLKS